jgi:hypothetical protein
MGKVIGGITPSEPADPIERHRRALDLTALKEARAGELETMMRRVPKLFHKSRVKTYEPRNASQAAALQATQEWIRGVLDDGSPRLALIGDTGVGKSHLLWSAAWALFEGGRMPYVVRWATRFADELRYGRGDRNERGNPAFNPWDVRHEWYEQPCSLIDEMRPTSGTEHDAGKLAKYAMHAYDEMIPVMGTTNMARLEDVMGAPAADRFVKVTVRGESERGT